MATFIKKLDIAGDASSSFAHILFDERVGIIQESLLVHLGRHMYLHDFNNSLVPKLRIQAALINDIFLACLMIIVSGCSIPYAKTISQYENAAICCTSMDKFIFEPLQVGDSNSFDLNEKSPAYQFLTGKSYFKALSLPQSSYPYVVNLTSYVLGDYIDLAYIFYPQLITLNENYELIRYTNPQDFKLR